MAVAGAALSPVKGHREKPFTSLGASSLISLGDLGGTKLGFVLDTAWTGIAGTGTAGALADGAADVVGAANGQRVMPGADTSGALTSTDGSLISAVGRAVEGTLTPPELVEGAAGAAGAVGAVNGQIDSPAVGASGAFMSTVGAFTVAPSSSGILVSIQHNSG